MFSNIVVGSDGSATANVALEKAVELARATGARLHVVAVAQSSSMLVAADVSGLSSWATPEWDSEARQAVDTVLSDAVRLAGDGVEVNTHGILGDPGRAILDVARAYGADLIVVGNRGMKGARRILGSVPNAVSHGADCSVLIVRTS
jgi:nucleotide-binding universal stress UspA family protein